jgi:predicted RNase H-like HicB family nuclease
LKSTPGVQASTTENSRQIIDNLESLDYAAGIKIISTNKNLQAKWKEMKLFLIKYINKMLKKADYEYDSATNSWCASVDKLPGVYAQADTIDEVRSELAEIIEEYVFVSLQEGHPLPEFKSFRKVA